jgi:acyl-CoA reductase-like NAD-dependent aldehyde dehydrogenase
MPTKDTSDTTVQPTTSMSTGDAINVLAKQLAALQEQAALEAAAEAARIEANKPPVERRVDRLEKIIEHLNTQIVKLSGHSYTGYIQE